MIETKFLKPKPGLKVRNADRPRAPFIDPDGERLPVTKYINRRILAGDLVEALPPEPVAARRLSSEAQRAKGDEPADKSEPAEPVAAVRKPADKKGDKAQ